VTLSELIAFFDATVIGTWTPEEWEKVLEKIKKNRGRYGMGQWV
jgi:hypothetical protein